VTDTTARMRDGTLYAAHRNEKFLGNGTLKSCGRCGLHFPPSRLRKWRLGMLACEQCRGVK
jgi:hypothetical protein